MAMTPDQRRTSRAASLKRYNETHSRNLTIKFHREKDADILARLAEEDSAAAYIKSCIRKSISDELAQDKERFE